MGTYVNRLISSSLLNKSKCQRMKQEVLGYETIYDAVTGKKCVGKSAWLLQQENRLPCNGKGSVGQNDERGNRWRLRQALIMNLLESISQLLIENEWYHDAWKGKIYCALCF